MMVQYHEDSCYDYELSLDNCAVLLDCERIRTCTDTDTDTDTDILHDPQNSNVQCPVKELLGICRWH